MERQATKQQQQKVLSAVKRAFRPWIQAGYEQPTLGTDPNGTPAIIWEAGPFEWVHCFPYGGREQEFGFQVEDVSDRLPAEIHVEPYFSYMTSIYREE